MRAIKILLIKEFQQIFRNPAILRMILVMPAVQLIIMPFAANYEVKNINLAIVNHDNSQYSQQLVNKILSSGYFKLSLSTQSYDVALKSVEKDKTDVIIEIPSNFEKDLIKDSKTKIFVSANAVNPSKAGIGSAYVMGIIREFNSAILAQLVQQPKFNNIPKIEATPIFWYNKFLNYKMYMVPGILVSLITMVGSLLASINLVQEKEIGTMEQINVTPIKKWQFILGKLIPFWIMGIVMLTIGMTISYLIFGIIPQGSFGLIYLFAALYLIGLLGIGLLISTAAETQLQANFIGFFVIMFFNMLSGLFTPIDGMPQWAIYLAKANPVTYFIEVMRMIIMKGSGFYDVLPQFLSLIVMAIVFNTLAILNYHKTN